MVDRGLKAQLVVLVQAGYNTKGLGAEPNW